MSVSPPFELASALDAIPSIPAGWMLLCSEAELVVGRPSVKSPASAWWFFRTGTGRVGVLDARCAHLGADLSRGVSSAKRWSVLSLMELPPGRTCERCGCAAEACNVRQTSYPAEIRHGFVYTSTLPALRTCSVL